MESKSREQVLREQSLRNEFEVWAIGKGHSTVRDILGRYVFSYTATAWESWQASRAALVVELPQKLSPARSGMGYTLIPNDNGDAYHCDDILLKLRAAGITVKGEGDEANANDS